MSDDELEAAIPTTPYFPHRPGPEVTNHQGGTKDRTRCRFLGDGVNDAVALHHADVASPSTQEPTSQGRRRT